MARSKPPTADRLIVALDFADPRAAQDLVERLGPSVTFFKIGMELAYGGGLVLAETLIGQGKQVFLDLKLHDIRTGGTVLIVQCFRVPDSLLERFFYNSKLEQIFCHIDRQPHPTNVILSAKQHTKKNGYIVMYMERGIQTL